MITMIAMDKKDDYPSIPTIRSSSANSSSRRWMDLRNNYSIT